MSDRDVRKLAKIVADHSRQIKGLSGGPQAAYSSIEGGSMDAYDTDGRMRLRIGAQDDGTHAVKYVQGPTPPRPTAPVVSVDGPVVRVRWDGMLLGGHIPEDFARVDVHFALASDDLEDAGAVRGNLATSAGNETVLAATETGTYRVGLVAVSQSRARSEMSDVTEVEVELVNLKGAIDTAIDNASGGSNHYRPAPPEGTDHTENDLWFDTSEDPETGLTAYTPHRWDETLQEWISLEDERVRAIQDAQDALEADIDTVRTSVDGKNAITQSVDAPPTQYDGAVGDRWERMSSMGSGGSLTSNWRWNGDVWVSTIISDAVLGNVDAAKIGTGYLDARRIEAGSITADKVLIGGQNLLTNDRFEQNALGWNVGNSHEVFRTGGVGAAPVMRINPTPGQVITYLGAFSDPFRAPVDPGETYRASAWVRSPVEIPAEGAAITIRGYSEGGTAGQYDWAIPASFRNSEPIPADTWARIEGQLTMPAGRALAVIGLAKQASHGENVMDWCLPALMKVNDATLIEDGAITTEKIAVGAITAESGIIGSLDAGVITVGEMNGARIEAGSIDTPQLAFGAATGDVLAVDALNFKTAVGMDFRSSSFRAGDAVEITEDFGIRQFGPDGALNVSLPSDGSPAEFRGDLSARTLTATGRMSIQGPGAIASGGVLELESGVVPPVAGPQITNTWDRITMPPLEDNETPVGIAWADGHWWRAVDVSGVSEGDRIEKITPTGELVSSFPIVFYPRNGMTAIGDELFLLGIGDTPGVDKYTSKRYVRVYGLDGTFKRQWEDTAYQDNGYQPGIGNDGTNIVRAQPGSTGILYLNYYDPIDGTHRGTDNTGRVMRSNVTQILYGNFDYGDGPKRIVAQQRTDRKAFVCYDAAPTSPDDVPRSWNAADFQNPVGLAWDGARFHSLTATGDLVSYQSHEANRFIGDDEDDWWGAVTWATGSQETTAGPATRFRYLHRAQLRVQNGDVPAGVEAARFYTSKGTAEPARTALQWRVTSEQPHEPLRVTSIPSFSGGTNPPATNTFTTDAPGEIRSTLGTFRVDGTGAGEWGPLTFTADGDMTGIPGTAAGVAVLSANATANGGKSSVVVTFPPGRFDTPPAVTAIAENGRLVPSVEEGTLTKTSVQLNVFNWTTTASGAGVRMHWTAVEVSS